MLHQEAVPRGMSPRLESISNVSFLASSDIAATLLPFYDSAGLLSPHLGY